jgi:site-specific DNA-methyltransferase (adenine-specific)
MQPYYETDGLRIYLGDCLEVMSVLPSSSVGLCLTSPPYNLREGNKYKRCAGYKKSKWDRVSVLLNGYDGHPDDLPYAEYVEWQKSVLLECWRLLDDCGAIFYNHKPRVVKGEVRLPTLLNPGLPLRQIVIWDRGGGYNYTVSAYVPVCEWVLILAKENFRLRNQQASGAGDVWRIPAESNTEHPAPFPYALAVRAIESVTAKVVLDPFMGSGTTLLAAMNLGREVIGIEKSERYCEMAVARIKRAQGEWAEKPKRIVERDYPLFREAV